MRFSAWQLVAVLVVVVLLFGAPKLPELARSLGKSMRILKDETKALRESDSDDAEDADKDADKDDA